MEASLIIKSAWPGEVRQQLLSHTKYGFSGTTSKTVFIFNFRMRDIPQGYGKGMI
jgi:hypothetical protein